MAETLHMQKESALTIPIKMTRNQGRKSRGATEGNGPNDFINLVFY